MTGKRIIHPSRSARIFSIQIQIPAHTTRRPDFEHYYDFTQLHRSLFFINMYYCIMSYHYCFQIHKESCRTQCTRLPYHSFLVAKHGQMWCAERCERRTFDDVNRTKVIRAIEIKYSIFIMLASIENRFLPKLLLESFLFTSAIYSTYKPGIFKDKNGRSIGRAAHTHIHTHARSFIQSYVSSTHGIIMQRHHKGFFFLSLVFV